MTSYMYNPSKKVTEVLSEYLEFDPEQLKLGIWSGNLSLQDVNLREEAIYPHLNKLFDQKGIDRIAKDRVKPPLRMKLISGSIGELSMKIPWKSLVWGQGDVSVEMRNVVLTLALESREETRKREKGDAHSTSPDDDTMEVDNVPKEKVTSSSDPSHTQLSRDVKRRMIREAEKRLLTGRNVTGWLRKTLKDEEEKRQKALDTRERVQEESKVEKWLKGATSDFFWRFYTGLQMKIENLKVVIVQDGVEVGVVMPSIQLLAGVSEKKGPGSQVDNQDNVTMDSTATPPVDVVYESAYEDGEHVDKHIIFKGLGVYVRQAVTADKLANRSSMVHVNDVTTKEFIVRPFDFEFSYSLFFPFPLEKRKKRKQLQASKAVTEDIESVGGTLSTSSTKRRRGKREKVKLPSAEESAAPTETTGSASFPVSVPPTPDPMVREQTGNSMSTVKKVVMMRRASIQAANQQYAEHNAAATTTDTGDNAGAAAALTPAIQQQAPKPKRHARRSSLAAPLMGTSAPSIVAAVSKLPPKEKNNRKISAPLALPNSVKKAFAAAVEGEDLTTRLDSRLNVSAIQVVFSTRQYHLLDVFLASIARMRNGRPTYTIKSVLDESAGISRGIAVLFPDFDGEGRMQSTDSMDVTTRSSQQYGRRPAPFRMGNTGSLRAAVIRGWWNYAYSVVLWELRQRKRLRRMFQDRFLSFNWERQRHRRSDYVRLFIVVQLAPQATPEGDQKQPTSTKADEDELLRIEDELLVEQVLLYRAIARVLHVRGLGEMPVSILDLRARQEKRRGRREVHHSFAGSSSGDYPLTRTSRDRGDRFDSNPWNNMPQILAVAGKRCELTRRRLAADHTDFLPLGEPFVKFSTMFRRRGLEESTVGMTIDTRVTKVGFGRKSRMGQSDSPNTSMKFSFTASLSKVEFLLVEDEGILMVKSGGSQKSEEQSTASSVGGSDVSGLTDDIRGWGDDETTGRHDDTLASEPIMNSTDFLLYKEPETTLLQMVLTGLGCSALGQSGGSRNLNLKVGSIEGIGSNACALLSVGTKLSDSASVAEVAIMGEPHPIGLADEYGDALNFSLVLQDDEHIVQCDMARIKTCMDVDSVSKVVSFPRSSPATYPARVLPRSGREEARLQVLNQSASTNSFVFMDSSIRIQGIDVLLPVVCKEVLGDGNEMSVGSGHGSVKLNSHEEGAVLRVGMVEFYSGSAVTALTGAGNAPTPRSWGSRPATRKLKMLDMEMFEEGNSSLLSYDWIIAVSGVDFEVMHIAVEGEEARRTSFLESSVELEMFGTTNAGSVFDFSRAKREMTVEVSPIDVKLSESRLRLLSRSVPKVTPVHSRGIPVHPSQPRLEVLSRFLLYVLDVSFQRIRLSMVTDEEGRVGLAVLSKYAKFEDFIGDFLSVVKDFDLSWPNEEALSAGMQICIDRLTGIGFDVEEGWQCANTALLNFLEDMSSDQAGDMERNNEDEDIVDAAEEKIQIAVSRTLHAFSHKLHPSSSPLSNVQNHLILDIPSGMSLSCVKLFYDFHCIGNLPSMFITNGEGIHILRLTPEVDVEQADVADDDDARSDAFASKSSASAAPPAAVLFRAFDTDASTLFGKGGRSLTILGESAKAPDKRLVEWMVDAEVGDVELLFCQEVFDELLETISDFAGPFSACIPKFLPTYKTSPRANDATLNYFLCSATAVSGLFSSDKFVPFCRINLNECMWTVGERREKSSDGTKVSAKSLSLLDLTSTGQLHPEPISVPPSVFGLPFLITIGTKASTTTIRMDFRGIRLTFLRQFLNECLQFFYYEKYGVGLFRARLREILEEVNGKTESSGSTGFSVHFRDCCVVLPRDSTSSDMAAVEVDEVTVSSGRLHESFSMPTPESALDVGSLFEPDNFSDLDDRSSLTDVLPVSRLVVRLKGFRIFTSTAQSPGNESASPRTSESPAFGFFFGLNRRAEAGKPVYVKLASLGAQTADDEAFWTNAEKSKRRWVEATCNKVGLDIIVDYAPHMRLLIADPFDEPNNLVALDVSLDQFCLLLTLWFGNMQQMPVLFPYGAEEFEKGARYLYSILGFPSYGTPASMGLLDSPGEPTSEVALMFSKMSLSCRQVKTTDESSPCVALSFDNATVHIISDSQGITRLGAGSLSCSLQDESKHFKDVVRVKHSGRKDVSFADTSFGLHRDSASLEEDLPLGFQLSLLMGPEWSLYNLGMQCPDIVMSDFSTIFRFLDFVTVYFADESFGNPNFEATKRVQEMKEELVNTEGRSQSHLEDSISVIDFRLWLRKPCLRIPCTPKLADSAFSVVGCDDGLWYRFSGIDTFSSQECVARGMNLAFEDQTISEATYSNPSSGSRRLLIDNLSFGLRINYQGDSDHTDVSLQIPYKGDGAGGYSSPGVFVAPLVVGKPMVCVPPSKPGRHLGPSVCEITCIVDALPRAWSSLYGLFNADIEIIEVDPDNVVETDGGETEDSESSTSESGSTLSFTGQIGDIRLFVLDPVLGPHLPVAVVSVADTKVTTSTFGASGMDSVLSRGLAPSGDLQVLVEGHIWADYFKFGITRSWEPLLEAYSFTVFFERSKYRGLGLTVASDVPLQANISGALLLILDECFDSFNALVQAARGATQKPTYPLRGSVLAQIPLEKVEHFGSVAIAHSKPSPLGDSDRVAFSLKNMTGQMLRAYRIGGSPTQMAEEKEKASLSYLDNCEAIELSLLPSVSLVRNLGIVEVEYPGLENSPRAMWQREVGTSHQIDIQVPGFSWIRSLMVDQFGRRFVDLIPRCAVLRSKVREDWRLANTMKLLVEIGLERGGREVAVRSLFSIQNMTTHAVCIRLDQNAAGRDSDAELTVNEDIIIGAGDSFPIPIVLLESALRRKGSHLGSFWLRPRIEDLDEVFNPESFETKDLSISLSTKPVQLAKVVSETSAIFAAGKGDEVSVTEAKSGVTLSCPVLGNSDEREVAPFCYALEIGRSPVVRTRNAGMHRKEKREDFQHGPVAYTINVHPPIVLVNLLPERGRFEIMHAVRRNVLWFADLDPGQQVPVHSAGLDAPLLLFINLQFCRTPIGDGALIHHGTEITDETRGGLLSIGKAGKAVTKQLGKTLTSLGESPDKRVLQKVQQSKDAAISVANRSATGRSVAGREKKPPVATSLHSQLGLDTDGFPGVENVDGQMYRVDTAVFLPGDCASETVVVDRIGQKLTLQIENIRGGGGQRRISVSSPFWIVNSTEHALRYKQDNSSNFVSGTVISAEKDGSVPIDGGRPGWQEPSHEEGEGIQALNTGTIFAGTPGALATSIGRTSLAPEQLSTIVDKNLPLDSMAKSAFMFNFHDASISIGSQKFSIQLYDGTGQSKYRSAWSRGFSLASVGYSQVVEMNCVDGRALELTVVVQTAPGHLSGYTKIVRILPRYIAVNQLSYPVRLWQDNSSFRPPAAELVESKEHGSGKWRLATGRSSRNEYKKVGQYESLMGREVNISVDEQHGGLVPTGTVARDTALYMSSLPSNTWRPFNLPDSRGDRQIRVGQGASWNLTSSISADVPGENTLRVSRSTDLRLLKHVSTRTSPQYNVILPPPGDSIFDDELGIWFETEWGTDRSLIVKAVKPDSYCFNKTDVRGGDELLSIDGAPIARMSFAEAMNVLQSRLVELKGMSAIEPRPRRSNLRFGRLTRHESKIDTEATPLVRPLTLTFRTAEERLRKVRRKAAKSRGQIPGSSMHNQSNDQQDDMHQADTRYLTTEMRPLHNIMFLLLREIAAVPYEIRNRSRSSTIYFRQRGCSSHPWRSLKPGAYETYTWEEPLKAKRLSLRVAMATSFEFVAAGNASEAVQPPSSRSTVEPEREATQPHFNRKSAPRKVRDEEDAVFSPSVVIRLEEIGFHEILDLQSTSDTKSDTLEMEVGVIGSTRVLVVQDASDSGGEETLQRHLDTLRTKVSEEERRSHELREMANYLKQGESRKNSSVVDNDPSGQIIESAKSLMYDFPEERTISARHQLVIEVIEAVGLSPDNYVGVCNPYVEVSLDSNASGRRSFFRRKSARRTYFVRKSVNPTWNSQSFVFSIPPEAVAVPRGHSVKVKVRNYKKVGTHSTLGRTQVELHSLRNQRLQQGWFPLAGRTGQRELENSISHWGRGSIKLKVHWVYTTSALLDYFLLLSETKLTDLTESIEGMALQLERKREEDRKRMDGMDGFRAVRLNDLLVKKAQHEQRDTGMLRILEPVLSRAKKSLSIVTEARPSSLTTMARSKTQLPPALTYGGKSQANHHQVSPSGGELEALIAKKRHALQSGILSQILEKKRVNDMRNYASTGHFPVTSFKAWPEAQKLLNDKDVDVVIDGDSVQVRVVPANRRKVVNGDDNFQFPLSDYLGVPSLLSLPAARESKEYAETFWESRRCFERLARCALRVALNPGGWLTIRPIQAKNLPDSSGGMSVKVRYDAETQVSESVDSAFFPTWFNGGGSSTDRHSPDAMEYLPGDLHFYIPPQRTNGYLRLSVVAEGRNQGIVTKTEVGFAHLPLGGAIAACVNAVEDYSENRDAQPLPASPVYVRWFPLLPPKDDIPVEGDRLSGRRAIESEKREASQFTEYFTPCIQLGLIWSPEVAREDSSASQGNARSSATEEGPQVRTQTGSSGQVQRYFNADVGQISVALIDSQRSTELLACSISDIDIRHWVTKAKSRFGIAVGWFQFDQQSRNAREPVVLAPTQRGVLTPVLQMMAVKDNMRSKTDVLSFDFIDVSISEFDLTVEERFLFELYDFFASLRLRRSVQQPVKGQHGSDPQGTVNDPMQLLVEDALEDPALLSVVNDLNGSEKADRRVYVQQLFLGVLKFNLSYVKGKKDSKTGKEKSEWIISNAAAGSEHADSDAFRRWSQNTSHDEAVVDYIGKGGSSLPSLIASLFPNVSDAPVRLQGKVVNHVFESPVEILLNIKKFYQTEILRQIYKIIGSLDFVGNPTMVLSSFLSGVRDLIVTPSMALIRSPTDPSRVGLGVAKGTLSLFSHSASGFFGFTSKVSAAAGQGLAILSLDKSYMRWHREMVVNEATNLNRTWKRRGLQNAGDMLVRPIYDIALGLTTGATGVIISPVNGFKRAGGKGLAVGVVTGIAGIAVKPAVGVLDALSHFTGSIHDIAKSVNVLEKRLQPTTRYRLPYVFGTHKILTPYDDAKARATHLLQRFPPKKRRGVKMPAEIVIHVEVLPNLGDDTYAIVTNWRLILTRVKKEQFGSLSSSVCWQVSLGGDSAVSSQVAEYGHNGVALTITVKRPQRTADTESVLLDEVGTGSVDVDEPFGLDSGHPSEELYETGADDYDHGHGTSRSKEGELLQWFTVVAEYQHRRQLCRLHNAVSCCSGNLDGIILDRPLGRTGSTEGYTSFGIFHFAEKESSLDGVRQKPSAAEDAIESLPWCNDEEFATGGPDWLRKAQQQAYSTLEDAEWNSFSSFEADQAAAPYTESRKSVRKLTRWLAGRLPTIPDADNEGKPYETPVKFVTTNPGQPDSSNDPATNESVNQVTADGVDSLVPTPMASLGAGVEGYTHDPFLSASSADSSEGFHSARASLGSEGLNTAPEEPEPRKWRALRPGTNRSLWRNYADGNSSKSRDSDTSPVKMNASEKAKGLSSLPGDEVSEEEISRGAESDGEGDDGRVKISSARIERMEALMEQLLIFNTEQTLAIARSATTAAPSSHRHLHPKKDELWNEVESLRIQLKAQAQKEEESSSQIAGLHAELQSLREQVISGSLSAYSSEATASHGAPAAQKMEKADGSINAIQEESAVNENDKEEFADCLGE